MPVDLAFDSHPGFFSTICLVFYLCNEKRCIAAAVGVGLGAARVRWWRRGREFFKFFLYVKKNAALAQERNSAEPASAGSPGVAADSPSRKFLSESGVSCSCVSVRCEYNPAPWERASTGESGGDLARSPPFSIPNSKKGKQAKTRGPPSFPETTLRSSSSALQLPADRCLFHLQSLWKRRGL